MAIRPTVVLADVRPLTVWFDGDCPICTAEIGLMRRLDRDSVIDFVDLSLPGNHAGEREARLARLHAQTSGGAMVTGAEAFVSMWRVLPSLRPLAALASAPPILWLLERAYRLFLKVRPALQTWVRWGLARRMSSKR